MEIYCIGMPDMKYILYHTVKYKLNNVYDIGMEMQDNVKEMKCQHE